MITSFCNGVSGGSFLCVIFYTNLKYWNQNYDVTIPLDDVSTQLFHIFGLFLKG